MHTHTRIIPQGVSGRCRVARRGRSPLGNSLSSSLSLRTPEDGLLSRVLRRRSSASHLDTLIFAPKRPGALGPGLRYSRQASARRRPPRAASGAGEGLRTEPELEPQPQAQPCPELTWLLLAARHGGQKQQQQPQPKLQESPPLHGQSTHCGVPTAAPAEAQPRTKMASGAAPRGRRPPRTKRAARRSAPPPSPAPGPAALGRRRREAEAPPHAVHARRCCAGRAHTVVLVGLEPSYIVSRFVSKWSEGFKMHVSLSLSLIKSEPRREWISGIPWDTKGNFLHCVTYWKHLTYSLQSENWTSERIRFLPAALQLGAQPKLDSFFLYVKLLLIKWYRFVDHPNVHSTVRPQGVANSVTQVSL